MRNRFFSQVNAVAGATGVQGAPIQAQQAQYITAQVLSATGVQGTTQLQVSNDPPNTLLTDANGNLIPVNWSNFGSPITVGSNAIGYIGVEQLCNLWLRSLITGVTGTGTYSINFVLQDGWRG